MPIVSFKEMDILKSEIEEKFHLQNESINYIATAINKKLRDKKSTGISISQLNKIWTHDCDDKKSSGVKDYNKNTLIDLVSLLDYLDWESYKDHLQSILTQESDKPVIDSYRSVNIDVGKLDIGEVFTLGCPTQYSTLKYLGGFAFEVLKSLNMHKKKGEIFNTPGFSLQTNSGYIPDIILDDDGDGYFNYHNKLEKEKRKKEKETLTEGKSSELDTTDYFELDDDEYYYL